MLTLSPEQCRVIGVLLEKESTTPEQYPLSLNALTNGCNQKSNRDPVYSLSDIEVQQVVDELIALNCIHLHAEKSGRVNKYQHRFCNTPFGDLQLSEQQRGILCMLLLRGAQTVGELKTRCHRLAEFTQVSDVEFTLQQLENLNGEPLVAKLPRQLGKRESRYRHLFSVDSSTSDTEHTVQNRIVEPSEPCKASLQSRVEQLEKKIDQLNEQLERFNQILNEPHSN